MTDRSIWFVSHLFTVRAGRRARSACEQLGVAVHERIRAAGDHLAATSAAVAQQFYRQAAAVWQVLGPEDFERWLRLGDDLLTSEPSHRDAALAYFTVSPKAVAKAGVRGLTAWSATGKSVAATSRKLGAGFFEGTAAFVDQRSPDVLAEGAQHGVRLHGVAGWRGEFLAHAYFAAGGEALRVLDAAEFGVWADLGVAVQAAFKESRFFSAFPSGLTAFKPDERRLFLTAALAIARVSAGAAVTFYTQLPAAVRRLHGPARAKLLEIFHRAGPQVASAVAEIVPVVGALVHDIPRQHRGAALDLAVGVADAFPRGSVALLRSLPAAYEDAPHAAVEQWVRRGLEIAAENAEAGTEYFGVESRNSVKVLQASSTAAPLADVQGLLRKYVQMLSGRPVSIRPADAFALRSPLEEFPLEDEIGLPFQVDAFGTHEDNCRLYRFLAAQLAGRGEFGTSHAPLPAASNGSLAAFLRAPEHPELLEELFLVAEGFRIAAALSRSYPGLAGEQRAVTNQFLSRLDSVRLPSQSELLDALLAWLLSGHDITTVPIWLHPMAVLVAPCVAPLANRNATVDDALAIAQLLTAQLVEPTDRRQQVLGDLFMDKVTGDALIDQYIYDYDDRPNIPSPAADGQPLPIPP